MELQQLRIKVSVSPVVSFLRPKSKVNPMPCKFAMFCSVNNLSNLPGYFFAFDHKKFAVKPKWNCNFHEYRVP